MLTLGGSYGGILSAFLRMKYPNVFDMALAASAPIPQIFNEVSPYEFYGIVTKDADDEVPAGLRAHGDHGEVPTEPLGAAP